MGQAAKQGETGKAVLLAEDVAINREVVAAILADAGVPLDCAADGDEACRKYSANPARYGMILMDLNMPGTDGFAAAKKIRGIGTLQAMAVPIIAMTANAFDEDIDRCIEAGMDGHIPKPVEGAQILAAVAKYLR